VRGVFSLGRLAVSGITDFLGFGKAGITTIGSGIELGQIANVLEKAGSAVGGSDITVTSEKVAQEAAERFLGPGSKEIKQVYGNRVGQVVGRISANGDKVVRFDTNAAAPHYNFVNKVTGGNLHVYFK
jgi:hypothetical protein